MKNNTFSSSTGVNNILATSIATLPWPKTATVSPLKSISKLESQGMPLYHPTIFLASMEFFRFSPGIFNFLLCSAP